MTCYRADKPNFLEFWLKIAKMTLEVKVNDPNFQYHPRISHDACLVPIWWFQLKSVTSYRADMVKFTDGRTDRRTDGQMQATTIRLRPERPKGKNHCWYWGPTSKSSGERANRGNPKLNRSCSPLTTNRTSANCGQNWFGQTIQHIVLAYWGFQHYENKLIWKYCSYERHSFSYAWRWISISWYRFHCMHK